MGYKGYKLLDKIILVSKDSRQPDDNIRQAYLVDPANTKQLESARNWATWTAYGKNAEGKYDKAFDTIHEPQEHSFDNNGFELKLLDCAGGSSQGGKLSFWNCIVSKDDNKFKIGINSDMLLDLLKNATFINGKCQSKLLFITQNGKVGMTVEGSETWKQCVKDRDFKSDMKKNATSKYNFGDIVSTTTARDVYLGTINQYYTIDIGTKNHWSYSKVNYRDCTLTKLAKPKTHYLFQYSSLSGRKDYSSLSNIITYYRDDKWSYPELRASRPKRVVTGQIKLDSTQEELYRTLFNRYNNYSEENKYTYHAGTITESIYNFLSCRFFGFNDKPFELNEDLLKVIKTAGIKYVEEEE